jgi:hypothetical protein
MMYKLAHDAISAAPILARPSRGWSRPDFCAPTLMIARAAGQIGRTHSLGS